MDLDGIGDASFFNLNKSLYMKVTRDAEGLQGGFSSWLNGAKELTNNNERLMQSLETQQALISTLRSEITALTKDNAAVQSSRDGLVAAKEGLESDITELNRTVQIATEMIGRTLNTLRKLENEKNACKARVETLEFDLAASDALAEALEMELVKLRAARVNDYDAPKSDGEQGQGVPPVNVKTENTVFTSNEQTELLQSSIERLQHKYNRLLSKKESAEQRFYTAYVEWNSFKEWWSGFSKFPGVARRILTYNRDVKNGAWIPGVGTSMAPGGKGRILRVIAAAEEDPEAFPNVAAEDVDPEQEADQQGAARNERNGTADPRKLLEEVYRELQGSYELPHAGNASKDTLALFDSANRPEGEQEGERQGLPGRDGSFDPEKTQETTPVKSQKQAEPFRFDLAGLNLPPVALHSPAVRPILERPRLLSPEPSQVIVIKDEPQDPDIFTISTHHKPKPLAATIKSNKATTPSTGKPPSVGSLPPPLPSTLGKRKPAREGDVTPGIGGSRRLGRVQLQLQYMDGTVVPTSESSTKRRRGLEDDDNMESPSVRTFARKGKPMPKEGSGSKGKQPDKFEESTSTMNARYEINPTRNGGLNFAFDEVVRKKDERRKMDAGACPDCVEYYKAVGPMPPRAQAPLWRSPTSSQEAAKNARPGCVCRKDKGRGDDEAGGTEIAAHQQQISRHRYHFPAPATPPGYWDLGFPDTQQVSEINEKAERLHERKERGMEMEARKSDGKYRRR